MLYVFHVDTGNMMTLDMSLTTESVQTLKEYVEQIFKIPADKQVLLISGGECLDSTKRVCSYSAGTDTNPIYLFSRSLHDATYLQSTVLDFREEDLLEKEKRYAELPPSFQTVSKRAQLAQQFSESAIALLRKCEELVSDQHNQHQGWAAVIANFEDVLVEFKCQFTNLECDFNEFLEKREYFVQFLNKFKDNLTKLRKIPIVPKLLNKSDDKLKYLMETSETVSDNKDSIITSLYDWIGKDEFGNDLEMIYERCMDELNSLNRDQFNLLSREVMDILISAEQTDMREIRGLGQRLFGLDKLIQDAKKKVQDQTELATSVNQNQCRLQNLKDSSILPDLCDTHIKQLSVMAENHKILMNSRQICTRAKAELNMNLNKRLEWVMHAQNNLQRIGDQIDVFSENIAKLRYQLGILEQVDMAPVAYLSFIFEIVRRRSFSQAFLVWASELACRLLTIHSEEVARRKDFQSKFDDHFIQSLFPGMDDLPPGYGIQAPSHFDTVLPKLTEEDIEYLRKELPEMTEYLNETAVAASADPSYFLLFKSLMNAECEKLDEQTSSSGELILKRDQIELSDNLEKIMRDGVKESSLIHCLPHLKDIDKGCESETDTEEFEKVGQSPLDLNFDKDIPSPRRPGTQDASTLTEDNLEVSKTEYDELKALLFRVANLAAKNILQLKSELIDFKQKYSTEKMIFVENIQKLGKSFENLRSAQEREERTLVQRMMTDHSNEIADFRKLAQVKNEEIKNLRTNNNFLENKFKKISEDWNKLKEHSDETDEKLIELQKKIPLMEMEKEKCIKELTERLNREHRDEIKTLQARFKLMTMERTPSESSLEKNMEFSSLTNHESIINHMRENFELEKEKAVKETLAKETEKWEGVIKKLWDEFEVQKKNSMDNTIAKINEEKNKEIEILRHREQNLLKQIEKYTSTIEMLTNSDVDGQNIALMNQIETLSNEKSVLNSKLEQIQSDYVNMAATIGSCSTSKTDSSTSPFKRNSLTKSFSVSMDKTNKPRTESLKPGDCVVIVWDEYFESFRVVQNCSTYFFLHHESIPLLGLSITDGPPKKPNKLYCLGEYESKEYCHARKSGNRYKVPEGTRFFRVKAKPMERESPRLDASKMSVSSRRLSSGSSEPEFHSLPSSPKIRRIKIPENSSNSKSESDNKNSPTEDESLFRTAIYHMSDDSKEFMKTHVNTSDDMIQLVTDS